MMPSLHQIAWLAVALAPMATMGELVNVPPSITVPPDLRARQTEAPIDPISLAEVLLTAVPASLRQLAVTNIPAVSRILWSEFLDENTPSWFAALPTEIQRYLSQQFGPSTSPSGTADSTNTRPSIASQLTSSSTSGTGASSRSTAPATVIYTSLVTVTLHSSNTVSQSAPTEDAHRNPGLSTGGKIGIGVGIPVAVLAIIALITACVLLSRRRRRRPRVSSRPPTPAFLSNSYRETSGLRGGAAGGSDSDGWDSGIGGRSYTDTPVPVPRQNRGSQQSFGSLHSVPEVPETAEIGVLPIPSRSPRRSRVGLNDLRGAANTSPPGQSSSGGSQNHALLSPLNPALEGATQELQHPAYRNRGSFSTPYGPYSGNYVPAPTVDILDGTPGAGPTTTTQPGTTSNWPFSRNYWRVQKPGYDKMYEGT